MRVQLAVLTACVLALAALPASGGEKDKLPVREVDLKGIDLGDAKGDPHKPAVITSAEDLAKAIPSEEAQAKIKKDVDFAKEKVLYFAWSGSGGDRVTLSSLKISGRGTTAVFSYKTGQTDDLRRHHRAFVLPKDATWSFGDK
jgi:hypothetical protein